MAGQGKRVLSVWFPRLPLDRFRRRNDPRIGGAFAIIARFGNAWRLTHPNDVAIGTGLTPGLPVADARSICPDLLTEPGDPTREAELLRALRRWADRLSPRVALDPPDGLLLDITGCAHLFGGETGMAAHARQGFHDLQIETRMGIADTGKAAWALARYGSDRVGTAPPGGTLECLRPLPVAALGLPTDVVADLRRTGVRTIGQLRAIRSSELLRRFGPEPAQGLDRALGHVPDPITPQVADPVYAACMTLPDPIGLIDDLVRVLERLGDSVCGRLQAVRKGARRYHLTIRCVDTGNHLRTVGFAEPVHDTAALLQQFRHALETLTVEFGADRFRLVADDVEPVQSRQRRFDGFDRGNRGGQSGDDGVDVAEIVSTLGNRLGFDRIRQWLPGDSHLPEREFTSVEAVQCARLPVWKRSPRRRPIRLYTNPECLRMLEPGRPPRTFEWRRRQYEIASAEGPERLASEWWREGVRPPRDYWRIQTTTGLRLWLLTYPGPRRSDWYVAGRFP